MESINALTFTVVIFMTLEEFENHYRDTIDYCLNQLQAVVKLQAQLEATITNISQDLQMLSQTLEQFVNKKKAE